MKSRLEHVLPIVLLVLLAGLTLWLRQLIESPGPAGPARETGEALAVVDRFTVTQLDANGAPEYKLSARRMNHFAGNKSTELIEPRFERRQADASLTVVAQRGRVEHDYKEAHFYDGVELVRTTTKQSDELRMKTEYLHVLPDRDIARTDRSVVISQGRSSLSGMGMEYNRQTGELRLLSSVKGSFDAKRK
jgi:lipopolysaccharide export system protein LptC